LSMVRHKMNQLGTHNFGAVCLLKVFHK
jgi:hypothetical protein